MDTFKIQTHSFNIEEAKKYGIEKAILLYNLRFWLDKNKANRKNVYIKNDTEYFWTFNSASAFLEIFPYMSESSIKRWLTELEKDGIILTGNFNKRKNDRTKWYTMPEYSIAQIEPLVAQNEPSIAQNERTIAQNEPALPDINTDINTDNNNIITLPKTRGTTPCKRLITIYKDLFYSVYKISPEMNYGLFNKVFNDLLKNYSEVQISWLLIVFFTWRGMDGKSQSDYDFYVKATYPLPLFKSQLQKFIIYTINVLEIKEEWEDDKKLLLRVANNMLKIKE